MFEKAFFPSFEEGWLRPTDKMSRYLKQGAAGEVRQPTERVMLSILQRWRKENSIR